MHCKSLTMNAHSFPVQADGHAQPVEPLMQRLMSYGPLSGGELGLLRDLSSDRRRLKAGERLVVEGSACSDMFILQRGRLPRLGDAEGRRAADPAHPPPGRPDEHHHRRVDAGWRPPSPPSPTRRLSQFPRTALRTVFAEHPRLAAMLYGVAVVDNVSLNDRLKSLGRTDGRARIAPCSWS